MRLRRLARHRRTPVRAAQPERAARRKRDRPLQLGQPFLLPSAQEVRPAERGARAVVPGIELHRVPRTHHRLVVPSGAEQGGDHVQPVRQRIQLLRPPLQGDGLIVAAERRRTAGRRDRTASASSGLSSSARLNSRSAPGPVVVAHRLQVPIVQCASPRSGSSLSAVAAASAARRYAGSGSIPPCSASSM